MSRQIDSMIPTLGNGQLFILNRDRQAMQDRLDKRKTVFLTCGIFACVTVATMIWIIYA